MANVRALRSGNWSDTDPSTSPWGSGGNLYPPVAGDVLYMNGYDVVVDTSPTCSSITNVQSSSITFKDGGTAVAAFNGKCILTDGVIITANFVAGTAWYPLVEITGSASASIVGNITNPYWDGSKGLNHKSTGTVYITGNLSCLRYNGAITVEISEGGTLNLTGNIISPANAWIVSILRGRLNMTGDINVCGVNILNGAAFVTGNITLTTIEWNGAGITSFFPNYVAHSYVRLIGDATAYGDYAAIHMNWDYVTNDCTVCVKGNINSSTTGTQGIVARRIFLLDKPSNVSIRLSRMGDGTSTWDYFKTADNGFGQAMPTDVRYGTIYADGNLEGTMYVPDKGSVDYGVVVGDTTGTAVLTTSTLGPIMASAISNYFTLYPCSSSGGGGETSHVFIT